MKVFIGGTRGTAPVADPQMSRFGGDTTAIWVEGRAGEHVLFDAGTGLRRISAQLIAAQPREVWLLFSHFHLDHVMGWPAFPLLYQRNAILRVASAHEQAAEMRAILSRLMQQPLWPVSLDKIPAKVEFTAALDRIGSLSVRWCALHHPGGSMAYRLDEESTGAGLVFATDLEWPLSTPAEREAFLRLCRDPRPANLLLFDGQWRRANYAAHEGWGHSRWEDGVDIARTTGIERLLIIHHAPAATDDALERIQRRVSAVFPQGALARDGMAITL